MMQRSKWALLLAAAEVVGCSSSATSAPSSASPMDGSSPADAATGEPHVAIGPIDVPANVEKTVCIVTNLGNTEGIVVSSMTSTLAPGSHHLIVYRTEDPENLTPVECRPFAGIASGTDTPILIATTLDGTFSFPSGVGLELKPNQRLRVEAHYLNTGATDLKGQGTVTFHGTPGAAPFQPADVFVWGTLKISIPPMATFSTGPIFQAGIAGTHLVTLSTHEHRLGTRVQVWSSASEGDLGQPLADDTDWANPAWRSLNPPLDYSGSNGLSFKCDWDNTTDKAVTFGEGALDEMCFVLGYYYPSSGVDTCIDGSCMFATARFADAGAAADAGAPSDGGPDAGSDAAP